MRVPLFVAACLVASPPGLRAQTAADSHNAAPCLSEPARKQFGFWVGEWTVTTKTGFRVGTSTVQIVSNGCAMLENWTSIAGANGKSLNTFNPVVGQWQQYWVGSDGSVTYYETSTWHDGSIAFLAKAPDNCRRLTFSPLPDGTVRQFGEQSTDGGKSWIARFEFFYHRKS